MDLLSFFAHHRRQWFDHTQGVLPDAFTQGGWVALGRVEVAFRKQAIYNAALQAEELRRRLNELNRILTQAQNRHEERARELAAAKAQLVQNVKAYKALEKHAGRATRTLEHLAKVAQNDDVEPEVVLRYMQELIKQHFANARALARQAEAAA